MARCFAASLDANIAGITVIGDARIRQRKVSHVGRGMNNPDITTIGVAAVIVLAVAVPALAWVWVAGVRARNATRSEALAAGGPQEPAAYAAYLLRGHERERRKYARSLHDELGSLLVSAKMDLETVAERMKGSQPELASRLSRAQGAIEQAVEAKRRVVDELYPSLLDTLGLAAAVEWEVSKACGHAGLDFAVEFSEDIELPGDTSIMLFRIVQEALANAIAHAGASRISVTIATAEANVMLLVEDDGIGIGDAAKRANGIHGIANMQQRARSLGGELMVRSKPMPETGTMVEANIPYSGKTAPSTAA
jgi:signal transduction histidine kinase